MASSRARRSLVAAFAGSLILAAGAAELRAEPGLDPEAEQQATPVVVDGLTLFSVHARISLAGPERARRIAERVAALASDPAFDPRSIQVVEEDAGTGIIAGGQRLILVTQSDSEAEHATRAAIAKLYREAILEAVGRFRADRSRAALQLAAGWTVGIGAALAAVLALILLLGRRVDAVLETRQRSRRAQPQIQSYRILGSEILWGALRGAFNAGRALLAFTACFVAVGFALRLFPWTRETANGLLAHLADPLRALLHGALRALPNLVVLALLFAIVRWVLKAARLFSESVHNGALSIRSFDPSWAAPTYRLVRIVVIAFALIAAYPYIPGSSSEAFKAISIFAGILFSLGSSSVISSIIAGYAMTYRRTFRVGDRVKIGDVLGDVEQIGLMVTRVRTIKNEEAVIPNSTILQGEVLNYSAYARQEGLILHVTVGIGYEVPWRQVEGMLLLAADRTRHLLREPRPFVLQRALADFCVNYELNVYCADAHAMLDLYTELHRSVLDSFNEYGVQIMTPAYQRDPAEPKIVPRDQWYAPPARVDVASPDAGALPPVTAAK